MWIYIHSLHSVVALQYIVLRKEGLCIHTWSNQNVPLLRSDPALCSCSGPCIRNRCNATSAAPAAIWEHCQRASSTTQKRENQFPQFHEWHAVCGAWERVWVSKTKTKRLPQLGTHEEAWKWVRHGQSPESWHIHPSKHQNAFPLIAPTLPLHVADKQLAETKEARSAITMPTKPPLLHTHILAGACECMLVSTARL